MRNCGPQVVIAFSILLHGATASAERSGWAATFEPAAVASYIPASGNKRLRILVASPRKDKGALAAAASLRRALLSSQRAKVAVSDESLGRIDGLDDTAIVKKCSGQPVDLIMILRLTNAGGEQEDTAEVTVFEKDGAQVASFTAVKDSPLLDKDASQKLAAPSAAAREEFDQKFVWFRTTSAATLYGTLSMDQAFVGKFNKQISGGEFLEAVGRPDLAATYRRNTTARRVLIPTGAVFAGVGFITTIISGGVYWLQGTDASTAFNGAPVDRTASGAAMAIGLVALGAGITAVIVGATLKRPPTGGVEARMLAEEYNKGLRKQLGLPEDYKPAVSSLPRPSLQLDAIVSASTGGLILRGTF